MLPSAGAWRATKAFPSHLPKDGTPKPTFWLEGTKLEGPNLPWLEVTGTPPDAIISKTDGHWNTDGNKYVMDSLEVD